MHVSSTVAPSIQKLFAAAQAAGYPLVFASGYRSEAYQQQLYQSYVQRDGQAAADRYSARPGTSEHQTGLAFDVCAAGTSCDLEQSFGNTAAGKWIANNAHTYGFILHYLQGKEALTGYQYEPWHLRYVGPELATELHRQGLTPEEFFGL
jgi:LAS superfamily LD-carboxypeptidase LdcB